MPAFTQRTELRPGSRENCQVYIHIQTGATMEILPRCPYQDPRHQCQYRFYQTFTTSDWCTQNCHRNQHFCEVSKVSPEKSPLSLKQSFPFFIPLTGASKIATKTSTFGWRAKQALINDSLSLERSERSFPLSIPLTGAPKIATKTSTFGR